MLGSCGNSHKHTDTYDIRYRMYIDAKTKERYVVLVYTHGQTHTYIHVTFIHIVHAYMPACIHPYIHTHTQTRPYTH